jgi:hypothetical protein
MPKRRQVTAYQGDRVYPSLSEFQATRRTLLAGGLLLGGGVALGGCLRSLGLDDEGHFEGPGGVVQEPGYYTVRLPPEPDDAAVYLVDGGFARFHVVVLTYLEECAQYLGDQRATLVDALSAEVGEETYESLQNAQSVAALEERLLTLLDGKYAASTGSSGAGWFTELTLTLTRLDAPVELGGVDGGSPEYP